MDLPVNMWNTLLTYIRQLARTEDTEVTIKFGNNKESIRVKASKGSLIAGSTYFADHWFKVSG
jgi:hypothetical protein